DDWLSFALECINFFFSEDTYLLKEKKFSIITEDSTFYNRSDFANFLLEHYDKHGINFSRQMINTYLKRGRIPEPDIVIGKTKYWQKETCNQYLDMLIKYDLTIDNDNGKEDSQMDLHCVELSSDYTFCELKFIGFNKNYFWYDKTTNKPTDTLKERSYKLYSERLQKEIEVRVPAHIDVIDLDKDAIVTLQKPTFHAHVFATSNGKGAKVHTIVQVE